MIFSCPIKFELLLFPIPVEDLKYFVQFSPLNNGFTDLFLFSFVFCFPRLKCDFIFFLQNVRLKKNDCFCLRLDLSTLTRTPLLRYIFGFVCLISTFKQQTNNLSAFVYIKKKNLFLCYTFKLICHFVAGFRSEKNFKIGT